MKKILLTAAAVMHLCLMYAQKSKGFDAFSYLKDYKETQEITSLNRAKESIDLAAQHADTKDDPFILVTKGQIYMALYEASRNATEKTVSSIPDEQKRALAVYENTPTNDLETAYQAFLKAKQLDSKGKYSDDLKAITTVGLYFDYAGRARFNAQKYKDALPAFERTYEISNYTDTTALYLAAVSAEHAENFVKAKQYYTKMVETKQAKANTYLSLINADYILKDTADAVSALKKGRQAFPTNVNLSVMEVNYYLQTDKGEEVLNNVSTALAANPSNSNLLLARGNVYENIASHLTGSTSDTVKQKKHDAALMAAQADYAKVVALDSNNFYGQFNLGILHFNKGVLLNNAANDMADNVKFKALNAKANEEFKTAMPLLEKALKLRPNELSLMRALKQIYVRLEYMDKLKAIEERMKK
jgi:Flp pilus assembly protein TadD